LKKLKISLKVIQLQEQEILSELVLNVKKIFNEIHNYNIMQIKDYVSKYDPENQFQVLIDTYRQVEYAWGNKIDLKKLKGSKFSSIIVTGLGGSAISGDLALNLLKDELKLPYLVNRNYSLPLFAGENTLLIVSSYSGNTEETIEVFRQGIERGCKIVAITTGGVIGKIANENNVPVVQLQKGFQPRYSLGLSFFSLLKVLQELNVVGDQTDFVNQIINLWRKNGDAFSKEGNDAYNRATKIIGYIPIIYSAADISSAVGYRLKCQFNENAKLHAFHNTIPELNHNEIIGWEDYLEKQFQTKAIYIIDKVYHTQIKKRFEITEEIISKAGIETVFLESSENDFKVRMMDLIYLCDWISYYTGILRKKDPSEIENINILKKRLA